jgi:hypothetical protein
VGAAWLDYTCEWEGDERTCPKADVALLVEKGVVRQGGLVLISVITRDLPGRRLMAMAFEMAGAMVGFQYQEHSACLEAALAVFKKL